MDKAIFIQENPTPTRLVLKSRIHLIKNISLLFNIICMKKYFIPLLILFMCLLKDAYAQCPELELSDQAVCGNVPTVPIEFANIPGTNYIWTNSDPSIGLPANGMGNIPSFIPVNPGALPVSATITVTARQTITFSYTGNITTWTVPSGVTNIRISAQGAQGGHDATSNYGPGLGADMAGDFTVTPGTVLKLLVGQQGIRNGGGGGTFVTDIGNNPLIIAGGGGGSGENDNPNKNGQITTSGADGYSGGGAGGINGQGGSKGAYISGGAGGGLLTNGANGDLSHGGGIAFINGGFGGNSGGFGDGGFGAGGAGSGYRVGGSGGGYSGAGGTSGFTAGSGGGSINMGTNQSNTSGSNSGDGSIEISYDCPVSQSFTITVYPSSNIDPVDDQTVCNGLQTAPVNFSGSGTVYTWSNDNPSIGLPASGSGNIPAFTAVNNGNTPAIANISVVENSYITDQNQPTDLSSMAIFWQGDLAQSFKPQAHTISGAGIKMRSNIGGNGTATISLWTALPNAGGMLLASASAPSSPGSWVDVYWTPLAVTPGTTYYLVFENTNSSSGIAGNTNNPYPDGQVYANSGYESFPTYDYTFRTYAGTCSSEDTFSITVNPTPDAIATPSSQTICSGAAISTIALTGNVAGTSFSWTRDNTASVTGIAASGSGDISGSLTNTTNAPVTVTFTITPSANSCTGDPITATVLVNPTPTAVATPASQTICSSNAITTIALSGAVSGTTYTWTRNNTASVTGIAASGSGNISGTLTNTTSSPVTVTFTITPTANGCSGTPVTATVLVNPTPTAVATPASQSICTGSAITTIALSGAVSGTTYTWTRDNTASVTGIPASGSGNISGTLTNTTSAPVTVTFTITPTANGCTGASVTATVVVNPVPNAVATPASQTICSGDAITTIVLSGVVSGTAYTWTRNNTASVTGIPAAGSGNISGWLTNNTSSPVTVTFTITPSANGCTGTPVTATVLVNPAPQGILSIDPNPACVGSTVSLSASGGTSYAWSGPHGWSSVLQSPSVYIDDHLWAGIYTVTITANGGCQSILFDTLEVFYPPVVSITYKEGAACAGSDLRLYGSGAGTYAWSGPNGWSSTERDPLIEDVTTAHSGTYTLTVTAANGCSATASVDITIHVPQPVTASPAVTHACEGNTVQLFAQGSGTSFQWSGPATYYSTQQNPVIHNIPIYLSGIYTVRMIDENGCISSGQAEVRVYDHIYAVATATPDTVCEGQSVQLHAQGGSTYLWNGPNGFFSTDPDPRIDNVTLQHEGTYYVYIYNEGGCFGYAEVRITVRPSARGFAYASPNPVNEGQNVQFFASDGVAYQWSGPNGWSSMAQNPIITRVSRAMAGVYIVTITNENGCPTVVRVVLKVSYKNNGGNGSFSEDDGLNIRSEETGRVYPNPTNDYLYFETPSTQSIEYTIYDMTGRIHTQGTAQNSYISTGQMPSGVYLIRWKPQDLQSWNQNTFVKIR